jgi:ferredoxin
MNTTIDYETNNIAHSIKKECEGITRLIKALYKRVGVLEDRAAILENERRFDNFPRDFGRQKKCASCGVFRTCIAVCVESPEEFMMEKPTERDCSEHEWLCHECSDAGKTR